MKVCIGLLLLLYSGWALGQCKMFIVRPFTDPVTEKICSSALLEDVKELYSNIQQAHPDLYRNVSKETFDSSYLNLVHQCSQDLTLLSFVGELNKFLQLLKDSHTFVSVRDLLSYRSFSRHYLPLRLMEQQGEVVVVKAWENTIPSGVQLLSINSTRVSTYLKSAPQFAPIEAIADSAFHLMMPHVTSALMNLSHPNKWNTVVWFDGKDSISEVVRSPKISKTQQGELFKGEPIEISFERKEGAGILKIASFSPRNIKGFKKKLDQIFQEVTEKPVNKLIIDLRNNTGGYIVLQEYLMSFLVPKNTVYAADYVYKRSLYDRFSQLSKLERKRFVRAAKRFYPNGAISREYDFYNKPFGTLDTVKNSPVLKNKQGLTYWGPCDLLVNELSMSASANFTAWFTECQRGEVIGSPVSGTNGGTFANPYTFYLTNTGLPVSVSTMKINLLSEGQKERPLLPNHWVIPSVEEIKKQVDGVLNFALKH